MRYLQRLSAQNFLSLRQVDVPLSDLNVLVGPNGAGKSNFLSVIEFLGETARLDLLPAIANRGGFDAVRFRGEPVGDGRVRLGVVSTVTRHSGENSPEEYELSFWQGPKGPGGRAVLGRQESFKFKRTARQGRRITVRGAKAEIVDGKAPPRTQPLGAASAGLSTLRRLGEEQGAPQVEELALLFETFRVFDVNVAAARRPSLVDDVFLRPDGSNVAAFLWFLSRDRPDVFAALEEDLGYVVPGLTKLAFKEVGGSGDAVAVEVEERSLRGTTPLAAASFGTIRALALLAMLHDPEPPRLTCVEEIDHGLHPHALDRIVLRLRDAKPRTQLLVATHSPALVNRLDPSELLVCERDPETGATRLPAVDAETVADMAAAGDLHLGELWFSGALGGALP